MNIIDQKHIDEFHEQGFTLVPGLVDESRVSQIFSDIEAVFDQAIVALGCNPDELGGCDEKMLFLKERDSTLKSHCYDVLGTLDSVQNVTAKSEISDFARSIYDSPVCKQGVQIRIDDMTNDRLLHMHQELELMSLLGVNVWIPLIDIDSEGGPGLKVVPGSHKLGLCKHKTRGETGDGYTSVIWEEDESKLFYVKARKGDALLFHPFLFHGPTANNADHVRWTLVFRLSELFHMPYIKHADAPVRMSRHPNSSSPGCGFVSQFEGLSLSA